MKRALSALTAAAASAALAGCALPAVSQDPHQPPAAAQAADATLTTMVSMLAGDYANDAQWRAAPEELRRPPAVGRPYDWIDWQQASFYAVDAPQIGAHVVYLEWRRGADGEISRQRVWSFRRDETGLPVMDFFTIAAPERFAGKGAEPGAFADLSEDDLIGYGPACAARVILPRTPGWMARIAPDTCRIVTQSGRAMGIYASIHATGERVSYEEAGVLDDGSYAFMVPGGLAYVFLRTEP